MLWLETAFVGVTELAVRSAGVTIGDTVISVQGPQLLVSSDSVITPLLEELVLSAQTRAEYVSALEKVVE